MTVKNELLGLVYGAIEERNQTVPKELYLEQSPDTVLFGDTARMDSLGLVSLILAVEEKIADDYGIPVSIADEKALSQTHSPFKTVGSLSEYIGTLLDEAADD